jgi:hypothetical protein
VPAGLPGCDGILSGLEFLAGNGNKLAGVRVEGGVRVVSCERAALLDTWEGVVGRAPYHVNLYGSVGGEEAREHFIDL